jgi:hypothetical protein
MSKAAKPMRRWRVIEIAKKGRHIATVAAPDADAAIKGCDQRLRHHGPAPAAPARGAADRVGRHGCRAVATTPMTAATKVAIATHNVQRK